MRGLRTSTNNNIIDSIDDNNDIFSLRAAII